MKKKLSMLAFILLIIMLGMAVSGCGSDNNLTKITSDNNDVNEKVPPKIDEEKRQQAERYYEQAKSIYLNPSSQSLEQGLSIIENALEIDTYNIEYYRLKADILFDLKEYQKVINIVGKVFQQTSEPSSHDYWLIAQSYEELDNLTIADNYYDQAIIASNDKKRSAIYWLNKAGIANKMGNYDVAMDCFGQAQKADPSFKIIVSVMEKFYGILGNPTEMLKYEEAYRTYDYCIKGDSNLNLNKEIQTLKTAVSNGQLKVNGNFQAIYKCVSSAAFLGVDLYLDKYNSSSYDDLASTKADDFYLDNFYSDEIVE